MQCALPSSSCGILLSGAVITSENTAAAASSRLAGSLSAASSGVSARVVATVVAIINFTGHFLPLTSTDLRSLRTGEFTMGESPAGAAASLAPPVPAVPFASLIERLHITVTKSLPEYTAIDVAVAVVTAIAIISVPVLLVPFVLLRTSMAHVVASAIKPLPVALFIRALLDALAVVDARRGGSRRHSLVSPRRR